MNSLRKIGLVIAVFALIAISVAPVYASSQISTSSQLTMDSTGTIVLNISTDIGRGATTPYIEWGDNTASFASCLGTASCSQGGAAYWIAQHQYSGYQAIFYGTAYTCDQSTCASSTLCPSGQGTNCYSATFEVIRPSSNNPGSGGGGGGGMRQM